MKHVTAILSVALIAVFVVVACAPAATPIPAATMAPKPTEMPAHTATSESTPRPMDIVDTAKCMALELFT